MLKTLHYSLLTLTGFLASITSGYAQNDSTSVIQQIKKRIVLQAEVENGGILAEKSIRDVTFEDAYYNAINFRVGWQTQKSKDSYHQLYNYPTYGIGIYSSTFNKPTIGKPFAIYGYVEIPMYPKAGSRWSYDYRIALGLSGNFKPFDAEENPLNLVIGTKNNVFIDLGAKVNYALTAQLKAGVGLSFHHFSNGALRLPNKGINLVPLTASLTYTPYADQLDKSSSVISPMPKQVFYTLSFGAGLKQISRDSDKRFYKSTFSAYASKHISHKWRLGGGMDIFYSQSGSDEEVAGANSGKLSARLSGGPSLYIAHVLNKNLVLNGNIGAYVHRQEFNGETQLLFLRAGARYYVYKNINAGVSIKAHMGKADFIEWTAGYTFGR